MFGVWYWGVGTAPAGEKRPTRTSRSWPSSRLETKPRAMMDPEVSDGCLSVDSYVFAVVCVVVVVLGR